MVNARMIFLGLGLAAVAAVWLAGCKPAQKAQKPAGPGTVPVTLAQAEERDMPVQIRTFGAVEPFQAVAIKAQAAGELVGVHVTEGQEVRVGDPLFSIDPRMLDNNVAAASARLKAARATLARDTAQMRNAKADFERAEDLFRKVPPQATPRERDQAQFAYDAICATTQAEAAAVEAETVGLRIAELNRSYADIRSPVDGFVGKTLFADKGSLVKVNDVPMLWVNQVRPIFVTFSVPQSELMNLRRCMAAGPLAVEVRLPAAATASGPTSQPDGPLVGTLVAVSNEVDTSTGMIRVKAQFDNASRQLWPGLTVTVTLSLASERGVVVPAQAVTPGQDGPQVFVFTPDASAAGPGGVVPDQPVSAGGRTGTVQLRLARLGRTIDNRTLVDCVKAGEWVVVDGQLNLTPTSKVVERPPVGAPAATSQPAGSERGQ